MSDEFSGLEKLLGLPQGSTDSKNKNVVNKVLAKGLEQKTDQLNKELKKVGVLENLPKSELVKCGIKIEQLEQDKVMLRTEAFEIYAIAKKLLQKYSDDVSDLVDVNDRMYLAGGKLIDSVSGSLERLTNMILKFKQEAEFENMRVGNNDEDDRKEMTPQAWMDFVDKAKEDKNIKDAEVIE